MEQQIIRYFSGIIGIAEFMILCDIPQHRLQETKVIMLDAEYDYFKVECSNPITATQQGKLNNIVNLATTKLTELKTN